jgi:hypothetical protein
MCHNGASAIDLIFTSPLDTDIIAFQYAHTLLPSVRKHQPIFAALQYNLPSVIQVILPCRPLRRVLDVDRLRDISLDKTLDAINNRDIERGLECVLDIIRSCVLTAEPSRRRHAQPWFDEQCFVAKRFALQALQLARCRAEMRPWYNSIRASYKSFLNHKRTVYAEKQEALLVLRAEEEPYRFVQESVISRRSCPIPITEWKDHFGNLLYDPAEHITPISDEVLAHSNANNLLNLPFTYDELRRVIFSTKDRKATGPDVIANEHLKYSFEYLHDVWRALFNSCLVQRQIPQMWRLSIVSVLYKSKGPVDDPDSYRGISKECCIFKVLCRIIADRLLLHCNGRIPQEQYGFQRGKSTLQAVGLFIEHVNSVVMCRPMNFVYACFIDFKKAFDSIARDAVMAALISLNVSGPILGIVHCILQYNLLRISDGLQLSDNIRQNVGVQQGDTMSPLLFVLLSIDLIVRFKEKFNDVKLIMFADDIVVYSNHLASVQRSIDFIDEWASGVRLTINVQKTKAMKFRRGGPLARNDVLLLRNERVDFVNSFTYLGVTICSSGKSFSEHIAQRSRKAIVCATSIKNPRDLSIETALKLFELKISPIASYAISVIWKYLSSQNLVALDKVKTCFLKRMLGVHHTARNRLVYAAVDCPTFIQTLQESFSLERTAAFDDFMNIRYQKRMQIDPMFYLTPAVVNTEWKHFLQKSRHIVTRHAMHGFHHLLCVRATFHHADIDHCRCKFCDQSCDQYHFIQCASRPFTLTKAASM